MSSETLKEKLARQKQKSSAIKVVKTTKKSPLEKLKEKEDKRKTKAVIPVDQPTAKNKMMLVARTQKHLKQRDDEEQKIRELLTKLLDDETREIGDENVDEIGDDGDPSENQLPYSPAVFPEAFELFVKSRDENADLIDADTMARSMPIHRLLKRIDGAGVEEKEDEPAEEKLANTQALWDQLDPEIKRKYVFLALGKEKGALIGRLEVMAKLADLPKELQLKFVKEYLKQRRNYREFYEDWTKQKDISQKIREHEQDQQRIVMDDKKSGRGAQIRQEALELAIQRAENHSHELSEEDKTRGFYHIIKIMAKDIDNPDQIEQYEQVLVKSLLSKYYALAKLLNPKNPRAVDSMNLASLSRFIERRESELFSNNPLYVKLFSSMSEGELVRKAQELGISYSENSPREHLIISILYKLPRAEEAQSKLLLMPKEIIVQKADQLGISYPENVSKEYIIISILQNFKQKAQRDNSQGILQDSIIPYYDKSGDLSQPKLLESQEEQDQRHKRERNHIISKLVAVTGNPRIKYLGKSMDYLREEYIKLEGGFPYWTETTHDKTELTNSLEAQKCAGAFSKYKWLDTPVLNVFIAPYNEKNIESIRRYSTMETEEIVLSTNPRVVRTFYKITPRFFYLQCNRFSYKKRQKKDKLICYDIENKAIEFIVAYEVEKTYKKASVKRIAFTDRRVVIQDEALFAKQQEVLKEMEQEKTQKINKFLETPVNLTSIQIATLFLSRALLSISPKNIDYGAESINTPYIRIAVESAQKTSLETNMTFFNSIARIIAFIRLKIAKTFHTRLAKEYYLPDVLMSLSDADMLPEVFENELVENKVIDGVSEVAMMSSYITELTNKIVQNMAISALGGVEDITAKRQENLVLREPKISLKKCVNYEEIVKKNIAPQDQVVYYDSQDGNLYCFDIHELIKNVRDQNFVNPLTNRRFSVDFIRRYMISYYDKVNGKTYILPFFDLLMQFKKGNFINGETKREFDPDFVELVKDRGTNDRIESFRGIRYRKFDAHVLQCQNPTDVATCPLGNVIYYKDPQDNKIYCFSIEQMATIIKGDGINPRTKRKFSVNFVEKFKRKFSLDLSQGGINQKLFSIQYTPQIERLRKKRENEIASREKREVGDPEIHQHIMEMYPDIYVKPESVVIPQEKLIIPDLWNIVNKQLDEIEPVVKESQQKQEEKEEEKQEEDQEKEETEKQETEDESDSETEDESDSETEDNTDDESEEESEEESETDKEETETKQKDDEEQVEQQVEKVAEDKTKHKCIKCNSEETPFKTVIFRNKHYEIVYFCSLECMEAYKFPHVRNEIRNICPKDD